MKLDCSMVGRLRRSVNRRRKGFFAKERFDSRSRNFKRVQSLELFSLGVHGVSRESSYGCILRVRPSKFVRKRLSGDGNT